MKLIHDIEDLEPSIKVKLIYLANVVIRDAKNGKAQTKRSRLNLKINTHNYF